MQGDPPAPADASRRWAAGSVVGLLLALLAATFWFGTPLGTRVAAEPPPAADEPGPVPRPSTTTDPAVLRMQALDQLMAARSTAVLARDRAAWLATVDPAATDFAARQGEVFDNLAQVPLAEWRYEYAGEGPALAAERAAAVGPDAWVARVVLVYRLAGDAGVGEVRREQHLTLVRRQDAWLVAGNGDGSTSPDLWDQGPVAVVRGERSLVLGTVDAETLRRYAQETDEAARRVDAVWGTAWPRTVVVHVPRSQADMARLLLRADEAGLEQIAAVTTGEVGANADGAPGDRVIVNPGGFAVLGPLGRQVVLTHEITHVATRAASVTDLPVWLSEGFADYVAYRDTGVSTAVVAQDVLDLVRAGAGPVSLPTAADFDPAAGDVAPAYSGAWLAADLIAQRWGEETLVRLYRSVAGGTPAEVALPQVLGIDEAALTHDWQLRLQEAAA